MTENAICFISLREQKKDTRKSIKRIEDSRTVRALVATRRKFRADVGAQFTTKEIATFDISIAVTIVVKGFLHLPCQLYGETIAISPCALANPLTQDPLRRLNVELIGQASA